MYAAIAALAGSTLAIFLATQPPPPINNTLAMGAGSGALIAADEDEHIRGSETRISLRDTTIEGLVAQITELSDRPVLVHWGMIEEVGLTREEPIDIDTDPLPIHVAHDLLVEHFLMDLGDDTLAIRESADLVEISMRSHFDARSTTRRTYDLSGFAGGPEHTNRSADPILDVIEAVKGHVDPSSWVDGGGILARATLVNGSLIVTAPERLHVQIEDLLKELSEQQLEQRSVAQAQSLRTIERLRTEYESLREEYISKLQEKTMLDSEIENLEAAGFGSYPVVEGEPETRAERARSLAVALQEVEVQVEELRRRFGRLQDILIDTQYEGLVAQSR